MVMEVFEVAGEGGGVTGDIGDGGDICLCKGVEESWGYAFAGRVEDGGVKGLVFGEEAGDFSGGIGADKACV